MMNSKYKAAAVIDEILKLISDENLHQQIELPIEKAYINFSFDRTVPVTHRNFTRITGELVCHIHKYGSAMKRTISKSQVRSEALSIIDKGYGVPDVRG